MYAKYKMMLHTDSSQITSKALESSNIGTCLSPLVHQILCGDNIDKLRSDSASPESRTASIVADDVLLVHLQDLTQQFPGRFSAVVINE